MHLHIYIPCDFGIKSFAASLLVVGFILFGFPSWACSIGTSGITSRHKAKLQPVLQHWHKGGVAEEYQ